jgi:hypothetical protein
MGMATDGDPLISDEFLSRYFATLAALDGLRKTAHTKPKSRWSELLNSSVLSTLITVVIGGLLGKVIVDQFQARQQRNAIAQAQYRGFIAKQQDIVQSAIGIIGDTQYDVVAMLALTKPSFRMRDSHGHLAPELIRARDTILSAHSDNIKKWNTESLRTRVLLTYYFMGNGSVTTSWHNLTADMDSLEGCAEATYRESINSADSVPLCKDEQAALSKSVDEFAGAIDKARAYTWQQMSSKRLD